MEGSKNYQRYRVEVAKLAPHFYLGSVGRGRGGGGISVGLEEFSDVGECWSQSDLVPPVP